MQGETAMNSSRKRIFLNKSDTSWGAGSINYENGTHWERNSNLGLQYLAFSVWEGWPCLSDSPADVEALFSESPQPELLCAFGELLKNAYSFILILQPNNDRAVTTRKIAKGSELPLILKPSDKIKMYPGLVNTHVILPLGVMQQGIG